VTQKRKCTRTSAKTSKKIFFFALFCRKKIRVKKHKKKQKTQQKEERESTFSFSPLNTKEGGLLSRAGLLFRERERERLIKRDLSFLSLSVLFRARVAWRGVSFRAALIYNFIDSCVVVVKIERKGKNKISSYVEFFFFFKQRRQPKRAILRPRRFSRGRQEDNFERFRVPERRVVVLETTSNALRGTAGAFEVRHHARFVRRSGGFVANRVHVRTRGDIEMAEK
jgi:hypothetical protein